MCRYYGLLAQRFCMVKREYQAMFEDCFRKQYSLIHRLETNKLRNVERLFSHLMSTDAIAWGVLQHIRQALAQVLSVQHEAIVLAVDSLK